MLDLGFLNFLSVLPLELHKAVSSQGPCDVTSYPFATLLNQMSYHVAEAN